MQVFFGTDTFPKHFKCSVVTLGVFDGLHRAHQHIIQQTIRQARAKQTHSLMVTFDPHPRLVLNQGRAYELPILTTPKEKMRLLEKTAIDGALFIRTDAELLQMEPQQFTREILLNLINVRGVIIGYDYHFGKDRAGDPGFLKSQGRQHGFDLRIIPPYKLDGELVNSSTIRELLLRGNVKLAQQMLGRPYSFKGYVVKGSRRGSQLGFPTANLKREATGKLIPKEGVYFTRVNLGGVQYYGICNIGTRPTFNGDQQEIEVHILDYEPQNLYEQEVVIEFLEFMRPEKRFDNAEELKRQLQKDRKSAVKKVNHYKKSNGG